MNTVQFTPVGMVINEFDEITDARSMKEKISIIIIGDAYSEALMNIEACEYIDIVFHFHKADTCELSGKTCSGENRGVFASRSPRRPNGLGITTVKLLERSGNELKVQGLDALNNSPVIDIKCADTSLFALESDSNPIHNAILKTDPRIEIRNAVNTSETEILLIKAGQLHGHFCPGLAMGVMASVYAMNELQAESDGMEDLLAITETNNCFSDGVQYVTGCSFGNNALIYKDLGKTAFTLARRNGMGIRICSKPESGDLIKQTSQEFQELYHQAVEEKNHDTKLLAAYKKAACERAFGTLNIPFEKLFTVQKQSVEIPEYASIRQSVTCSTCGESVIQTRTISKGNNFFCLMCAGAEFSLFNGNGIHA